MFCSIFYFVRWQLVFAIILVIIIAFGSWTYSCNQVISAILLGLGIGFLVPIFYDLIIRCRYIVAIVKKYKGDFYEISNNPHGSNKFINIKTDNIDLENESTGKVSIKLRKGQLKIIVTSKDGSIWKGDITIDSNNTDSGIISYLYETENKVCEYGTKSIRYLKQGNYKIILTIPENSGLNATVKYDSSVSGSVQPFYGRHIYIAKIN